MTDREKRQLRIMLDEQAKIHARKKRARIHADPKHGTDWPDGFTPAELGERAAKKEAEQYQRNDR